MKKNTSYTYLLLALAFGFALVFGIFHRYKKAPLPPVTHATHAPSNTVWMNVFMHGSFGTILGLLSVFNVMKDEVDKTNYKKMTSHMRYDHFFYQLQPLLAPGLIQFSPTFDASLYQDKKYAIFPVAQAYKELSEWVVKKNQANQRFYTFGWSGLVSQGRRRKEAIRFYNMLNHEYKKLVKEGYQPKIRIITHSHGGNVALNMAGIYKLLKNPCFEITKETVPDNEERDALLALEETCKSLQKKKDVVSNLHQKKWDYIPYRSPMLVDELILLGTPIQPETRHFFYYPFFKKIYNVYSDGDKVQRMDWVSTKRYYSEQRLNCSPVNASNKIFQVRLTLNKIAQPQKDAASSDEKSKGVLSLLFGMGGKKSDVTDPSHRELWFMGWKTQINAKSAQTNIQPYPFVILTPLFKHLVDTHNLCDVDIKLEFEEDAVKLNLYEHNVPEVRAHLDVPRSLIRDLQKKANAWQPHDVTRSNEMNILHNYSHLLT